MFSLQVTVSDGILMAIEILTIFVYDVNEPPTLLNLPAITTIPENHKGHVFTVDAADQESTTLSYNIKSIPSSGDLLFSIDSKGMSDTMPPNISIFQCSYLCKL